MSQAPSQVAAFLREVREGGEVWVIEDDAGEPAPVGAGGRRAMPFWSSRVRADQAVTSEQFAGCWPRRLTLADFKTRWLPGLERQGLLIGVNWSGPELTGHDLEPAEVRVWLDDDS